MTTTVAKLILDSYEPLYVAMKSAMIYKLQGSNMETLRPDRVMVQPAGLGPLDMPKNYWIAKPRGADSVYTLNDNVYFPAVQPAENGGNETYELVCPNTADPNDFYPEIVSSWRVYRNPIGADAYPPGTLFRLDTVQIATPLQFRGLRFLGIPFTLDNLVDL